MFNKIYKEIDDFSKTIKDDESFDKMLTYVSSNIYSAIKLLLFASSTFSIVGRVLMFLIIFLTGLIVLSAIGAMASNLTYLVVVNLVLFVLILVYIMHFKSYLISSIKNLKNIKQNEKS